MDAAQWPQGIGVVKAVDHDQAPTRPVSHTEKKPRPQKEQALNCPRCSSTNTKFCYYNNYSLTQPRYFCKTCRRYWTEGGSLRNVPVGGGSRKNKRSTTSSSSSAAAMAAAKKPIPDLSPPSFSHTPSQNPKFHGAQDLNLAYPPSSDHHHHHYSSIPNLVALQPKLNSSSSNTSTSITATSHLPPMEFLKNGISSRGLNSFMPMPAVLSDCGTIYSSGLPALHDFKPTLNFSLDGFENNGYGNLQGVQETNAKMFFPNLEDLKPVSTTDEFDHQQNRGQGEQSNNGYWSGMLGGGSW